ncbi:acyl-CoA dehydrogenase family protein, partial [Thermodesulfobacteriota bacterium]
MDFNPTERQKELLEPFRALCSGTIEPEAGRIDRERAFPRENIKRLGEAGYLGLLFPEEYGGASEGMLTYAILGEELAKSCPTTFLAAMYSSLICAGLIHEFGSDEAKKQTLPGLLSGELVGAVALTEPGCGSDYEAMKTIFAASGDRFTLDGTKMYVTNGSAADVAIV